MYSHRLITPRGRQRLCAHLGKYLIMISSCFVFYRPSSSEIIEIIKVFDAGMTMARINLSHGTIKSNLKLINKFK